VKGARVRINSQRLKQNLAELSRFGCRQGGGITRESFSEAHMHARDWLVDRIREGGLRSRTDEAGNVFGRLGPEGDPAVLTGSHLDTVPEGGMFDGALGVLASLECLQTIHEQQLPHKVPLEMVAFSDEEGAYYSLLGSRALTEELNLEEMSRAENRRGLALKEAMAAFSLDPAKISLARRDPRGILAYLELHIEQGPQLEFEGVPIGIVQAIVGIVSYWITFTGQASHAGTTPLSMRRDGFLGAAEFSLRVHDRIRSQSSGVVTVGNVIVAPGAFNIVPREARLALEFRNSSPDRIQEMDETIQRIGRDIAKSRSLKFVARKASCDAPIQLSGRIQSILREEAHALGYPYRLMESGAGHDAQVLALKTEAGMIFVPSPGGMSHCPEETCRWEDIEKGVELLLSGLLRLANEDRPEVSKP
jgi:N-carbamoyl-L-amino-acid hydrolase